MDKNENPYRAPDSLLFEQEPPVELDEVEDNLASRGARLGAAFLDGLIMLAVVVPMLFLLGYFEDIGGGVTLSQQIIAGFLGFGLWLAVNGYFLHQNGQTLGKKIVGIKIVKADGGRADLGRLVGLRYAVGAAIANIPIVGNIYGLIDVLFIFREDRRCVHDLIAGTVVVDA